MRGLRIAAIAVGCGWATLTPGVGAQTGLTLELGVSRAFPPSGTDAAQASYGVGGLRAERWSSNGSGAWSSFYGAKALDRVASDWISGDVGGQGWWTLGGPVDVGIGGRVYGFSVGEPFVNRAVTGEVTPAVRVAWGRALVVLNGVAGWGRSVIEVHRTDVDRLERYQMDRQFPEDVDQLAVRRAETELWHRGVEPEVRFLIGPAVASVGAGIFDSPRGEYRNLSVGMAGPVGPAAGIAWNAVAARWDTPFGGEWTGGLVVSVPFGGGWSARAAGLKGEPSPLVMTRGTNQGGFTVSKRFWGRPARGARRPGAAYAAGGGRVRFRLEAAGAREAAVLGDFTDWSPVAMTKESGAWTLELDVAPGLYHYGFMVDGEWHLPEVGVEGRVQDDWGRENGTLVVPEGSGNGNEERER